MQETQQWTCPQAQAAHYSQNGTLACLYAPPAATSGRWAGRVARNENGRPGESVSSIASAMLGERFDLLFPHGGEMDECD